MMMTDVKKIRELSGWLTFELDTKLLDPPILRVRVKPIVMMEGIRAVLKIGLSENFHKLIELQYRLAIECIQEWDLTHKGKPLPCNAETKEKYLKCLLGEKTKSGILLMQELIIYASELENFLQREDMIN